MATSLRWRVLFSMVVVVAVCATCMSLYLHGTRDVLRRGLAFLEARDAVAAFVESRDTAQLPAVHAGGDMSYTLYSADGAVLWMSADRSRALRLRQDSLEDLAERFWFGRDIGRIINVPVPLDDGGVLMVARRDVNEREAIQTLLDARLRHSLLVLMPLMLLFGILLWALMAWTLAPVRRAARLAEGIGPDRTERIPEASLPEEIRPLGRALNRAVARLSEALQAERQILADGAHELRTPLTVVDLRLQKFEQEGRVDWRVVRQDLQQLRRVTEQLLMLARQDHTPEANKSDACQLSVLIREVIAHLYPMFESRGRDVSIDEETVAPLVQGTPGLVREVIVNVLENALVHGAGTVSVRIGCDAKAGLAHVEVEDQGQGVPLACQHEYFRRFHKGSAESPGSGLGLAIVEQIMRQVGGTASFVSSSPCVLRLSFVLWQHT